MAKSTQALERLRAMLGAGEFGDRLPPERVLAGMIGVGRRTLRQALDVLEAEGRIWRRQGQGTFCERPPMRLQLVDVGHCTNPQEVMEVRLRIEPPLATLAALRATADDIERLSVFAARTATAGDADSYELWDGSFHRRIAEAAGNRLFLALFDAVNAVRKETAWERLREAARGADRQALYAEQHRRILAALAARDGARAGQAMHEHLKSVEDSLLQLTLREGARPAP